MRIGPDHLVDAGIMQVLSLEEKQRARLEFVRALGIEGDPRSKEDGFACLTAYSRARLLTEESNASFVSRLALSPGTHVFGLEAQYSGFDGVFSTTHQGMWIVIAFGFLPARDDYIFFPSDMSWIYIIQHELMAFLWEPGYNDVVNEAFLVQRDKVFPI